jgi:hypothetical protein
MKSRYFLILFTLLFSGCACKQASTARAHDPKLDSYFERYCDYTGGLGIFHVPADRADYEYRQRLKKTRDVEVKRVLVVQHLYPETSSAISDYERGVVMIGKGVYRPMTAKERASARASINERLDDLSRYEPGDPEGKIAQLRERMRKADKGAR